MTRADIFSFVDLIHSPSFKNLVKFLRADGRRKFFHCPNPEENGSGSTI